MTLVFLGLSACQHDDTNIAVLIDARKVESSQLAEPPRTSPAGAAFVNVMNMRNRKDALLRVFEHSQHTAGRVYALIGLHQIDISLYQHCLSQVRPAEQVSVVVGDVEGEQSVAALLPQIESGSLYRSITWTGATSKQ